MPMCRVTPQRHWDWIWSFNENGHGNNTKEEEENMKTNRGIKVLGIVLSVMVGMAPISDVHAALTVPVSRSVTVEATVSAMNILNIAVKNLSDDQAASKITFSNPLGIGTAAQYVQIDFNSNAVGARIVLRTDNKNNSKPFTGPVNAEGAGLVGNTDSTSTVPLLWVVFDDVAQAKTFVFKGDTDPSPTKSGTLLGAQERGAGEAEGLVVDKNNKTPAGSNAGEVGGYEDTRVQGYATVVVPQGTAGLLGGFPTDKDGATDGNGNGNLGDDGLRSCTSPVFLAIGADFNGVAAQTYSTNTLALDLIVQ